MQYQRLPVPSEPPPSYDDAPGEEGNELLFENDHGDNNDDGHALMPAQGNNSGEDSEDEIDRLDEHDDDHALRREMETFEVMEPTQYPDLSGSLYSRVTESSQRIANKLNNKFLIPVQQIILDPVVQFWRAVGARFDRILSRFGNPLMFKRLLYLFIVGAAIFAAISFGIFPSGISDSEFSLQFHNQEKVRSYIRDLMDLENMRQRSAYLSSMPHMAGTSGDRVLKDYIRDSFSSYGLRPIQEQSLGVFLTFPNTTKGSMQLKLANGEYEANLLEDKAYQNDDSGVKSQPLPILGLAASGEAEGPAVYANYGSKEDFDELDRMGITVKGAIVFMKYGLLDTGLKVMLAEKRGAVAAVMFDGFSSTEESDLNLPPGGVQRDHVGVPALAVGDLLTPGWSQATSSREIDYHMVKSIPKIPAIPVSWNVAKAFLEKLDGHGKPVSEAWLKNVPELASNGWWTGDSDSPNVYLKNDPIVKDRHAIWNVISKIGGTEDPRQAVVIGARRDSYCFGSSESVSGTVILMEVARILSLMNRNFGWEPLRSLYFASWDGSSENYIGSTEWVEGNVEKLRQDGIVYLNLDEAISGSELKVNGHPALRDVIGEVLALIENPSDHNKTLSDSWSAENDFNLLPPGGDHLSFQSHAGVASLSVAFKDSQLRGTKQSCFDTFERLTKTIDPEFAYHKALTELVAFLAVTFSDGPLLPFNLGAYGTKLHDYARDAQRYAASMPDYHDNLNFNSLISAGDVMIQAGLQYREWWTNWHMLVVEGESPIVTLHRRNWNARVALLEKNLLDINGHPNRNWFKHTVFGPQLWHPVEGGFEWNTFPGIRDAIQERDWQLAQEEITRVASVIAKAAYAFFS